LLGGTRKGERRSETAAGWAATTAPTAVLLKSVAEGLTTLRSGRAGSGGGGALEASEEFLDSRLSKNSAAHARPLARKKATAKAPGPLVLMHLSMRRWSSGEPAPANARAMGPSPNSNWRLPRAVWA